MSAGEASITINATRAAVYALVSNVTRTGEYSPECVSVEWIEPGKRFRGHNKDSSREWDMEGVIDTAVPERAFAFHTERDGAVRTKWGYRIDGPTNGPTTLTEWYERVAKIPLPAKIFERFVMGGRAKHNAANMQASLARIKAILEG